MKYLISMLAVFIFSCSINAQFPRLKADRVGDVYSSETWGRSHDVPPFVTTKDRVTCLWQEKVAVKSNHNVPIVCGKGDGECGVKDCKCTCHPKKKATCHPKKDAKKHDHKRGHSNDHKRGHHRGRTSSTKKTEVRKGPGSHQPGPVRPSVISETLRQRLGEAVKDGKMSREKAAEAYKKYAEKVKKNTPASNKARSEAVRKRIEEWRKKYDSQKSQSQPTPKRTRRDS